MADKPIGGSVFKSPNHAFRFIQLRPGAAPCRVFLGDEKRRRKRLFKDDALSASDDPLAKTNLFVRDALRFRSLPKAKPVTRIRPNGPERCGRCTQYEGALVGIARVSECIQLSIQHSARQPEP
jgi:hypothetical protein